MFIFTAQSSACNRLHSIKQRAGRWLLHTHDSVGRDEFPLTQEFLAQMLGVRRASVSEVAGKLQTPGLISYSRGRIKILDRRGLEAKSCECCGVITAESYRGLGGSPGARRAPEPGVLRPRDRRVGETGGEQPGHNRRADTSGPKAARGLRGGLPRVGQILPKRPELCVLYHGANSKRRERHRPAGFVPARKGPALFGAPAPYSSGTYDACMAL
jgi:hypothetical protein